MSDDQQAPSPIPRTLHDAMFKRLFSDPRHAAAELRAVLPPRIARRIEWATLEAGNINLVGANFKQQHGDLVFHAGMTDGGQALVWLLFEHQSTVDPWMPLRVLDLSRVFWERWREHNPGARRLPAIIPVVLYQGPAPWNAATSLGELLDVSEEVGRDLDGVGVACRFVLDDLGAVSDEELAARDMEPYPKLGLVVFKYGADTKVSQHFVRHSAQIRALVSTELGKEQWNRFVEYTWHVNPHLDRDEFITMLGPIVGQEVEHTMLSLADRIRLDGRKEGLDEGRSEGRRELVLQQLARRFGALSPEVEQRVAGADMDQLADWAMRLLDARSLDEVFNGA